MRDLFSPWERFVAHSGYIAEGVIYLLIGAFALVAALEHKEQPNGYQGAILKLDTTVLGKSLLVLLALGLAAFVLWQLLLAIKDPEHRDVRNTPRRVCARVGYLLNGLVNSLLVGEALSALLGLYAAGNEKESQVRWTARAMQLPLGRFAVGATGIGIIIFGAWQFYRALTRDKDKRVHLGGVRFRIAIDALGMYGLAGRGVLFGLVGVYLLDAARLRDPRYSGGVAGALAALRKQPYGPWLLGALAVSLMCYGIIQVIRERYRRLQES
jgi:uncharacterized integral membrane protein